MILKLIISSHLPILGKIESSDLLRLLDLLLVGLDLALQLLDNHLHPLVVLSVLLLPVRQLLDQPLRFPQVLMGIREPGGGRLALEPWGIFSRQDLLFSASSSDSSSLILVSILAIAFFPPRRALCSASSSLVWASFTWRKSHDLDDTWMILG